MAEKKVRVRFAPSPTGPLHIGGVRTALYNYLFAKKHGGDFLLRIEDTDQTRFVPGAEEYIIEALKWCGIEPNEGAGFGDGPFGPYKQSDRKNAGVYQQYADQLIEAGYAYIAFDTSEELTAMRERLEAAKAKSSSYNIISRQTMKNSLTLSEDEVKARIENGDPYVVRIKMPRNEEVRVKDLVRGWVVVNTNELDDKVLFKSDGMPTYHLANVVDDHMMQISHVIRGEEWLPSAPLHCLLYKYLGWEKETPDFAHLPLLLKPDGNGKLSKRDGDRLGFPVFPLNWQDPNSGETSSGYREKDYLPDAFINMLALLGWHSSGNQELFTMEELINEFSLERVSKSGAKFDPEKTKWFNQQYLRAKSNEELAKAVLPLAAEKGINTSEDFLVKVIELTKERATFTSELLDAPYLFAAPTEYDEKTVRKKWKENSADLILEWSARMANIAEFTPENVETEFKAFLTEKELGMGAVLPVFRLLVTGEGMGPSMFQIAAVLGKEEVVNRIQTGIESVAALQN